MTGRHKEGVYDRVSYSIGIVGNQWRHASGRDVDDPESRKLAGQGRVKVERDPHRIGDQSRRDTLGRRRFGAARWCVGREARFEEHRRYAGAGS